MSTSGQNNNTLPSAYDEPNKEWKGLTMDELRMRRAKSLVFRDVYRASLMDKISNTREKVSQNGMRGLLFSNKTITGLKKADYAFLGYKVLNLLIKLYLRRKR